MSDAIKSESSAEASGGDLQVADVRSDAASESTISPATGLKVLKEVWDASNRLAKLHDQYRGEAIPPDKLFGAILGFGQDVDPLAEVKQQLQEINDKLNRVLSGIEDIKARLLGLAVLDTYNHLFPSVQKIDNFTNDLPDYVTTTPQKLGQFLDKLNGTLNEADRVKFCVQNVLRVESGRSSLFLNLVFTSLIEGANEQNVNERYTKGVFIFHYIVDAVTKGLMLELFAVTADPDPAKTRGREGRLQEVNDRYKGWLNLILNNNLLPFAETMATLRFSEEYCGGNSITHNVNLPWKRWKRPENSILESADTILAELQGNAKSVTLRVVGNIPPIVNQCDVEFEPSPTPIVRGGTYTWHALRTSNPSNLTRTTVIDKLAAATAARFFIYAQTRQEAWPEVARINKTPIALPEGFKPLGYDRQIPCLRYHYNLGQFPANAVFTFFELPEYAGKPPFNMIETRWQQMLRDGSLSQEQFQTTITYYLLNRLYGEFVLPASGYLSPVLLTYAYEMFGERQRRMLAGEENLGEGVAVEEAEGEGE